MLVEKRPDESSITPGKYKEAEETELPVCEWVDSSTPRENVPVSS